MNHNSHNSGKGTKSLYNTWMLYLPVLKRNMAATARQINVRQKSLNYTTKMIIQLEFTLNMIFSKAKEH